MDYEEEMSDGEGSSRTKGSCAADPETTPKGKGAVSRQRPGLERSQSESDTGSKRGTVDDQGDGAPSPKRLRRSERGKEKAPEVGEGTLDLGDLVVGEDTPLDPAVVPRAAHTVGLLFLSRCGLT